MPCARYAHPHRLTIHLQAISRPRVPQDVLGYPKMADIRQPPGAAESCRRVGFLRVYEQRWVSEKSRKAQEDMNMLGDGFGNSLVALDLRWREEERTRSQWLDYQRMHRSRMEFAGPST